MQNCYTAASSFRSVSIYTQRQAKWTFQRFKNVIC